MIKMYISDNLNVNEKGHLTVNGSDTVSLAEKYGTPLYVFDEDLIRKNCRSFKDSIDRYYGGAGLVCFASKAFSCMAMYKLVNEEGLGTDVVSAGELYTALKTGFPAEKICFHGNNKTDSELELAVNSGVGRIVADNLCELERLDSIAAKAEKKVRVMFRIKPGIDAHTHDFVKTGQIDSKFGFALETGEAFDAVKKVSELKNIELIGLHCHIGSQIFDIDPFVCAAEVMMKFMLKIRDELGITLGELNLGGGFGIKYTESDSPAPYDSYMKKVSEKIKEICAAENFPLPFILIEPGRAIVGSAGVTLYTVGCVKHIPGIRTYVSIDGGMGDNPRYALYKSVYEAVNASHADKPRTETVTVAGKCCESGDLIGEGMSIQPIEPGDIAAVFATGAYNYSMASNYNRNPRPAAVFVNESGSREIIRRESLDDIIRNDVI